MLATAALAFSAAACGGTQNTETVTPVAPAAEPPPQTEDVVLEGYEVVKLAGMRFVPEGFGYPGMVRVQTKGKVSLDKQRKKAASAKPANKANEVKLLVSLLWEAKEKEKDKAKSQALLEEARAALSDLATNHPDQADDITLTMLFTVELWLDNPEGAMKAASDLQTRFADSKSTQALAPWMAFVYLRNWKTQEAAKLVEGWTLDAPDMDYLRAYVMAWVAFRKADYDAAREAIVWSAKNWKSKSMRPAVERDLARMLTRGGTSIDQVAPIISEIAPNDPSIQYQWYLLLSQGYELSGYPLLSAQALDKALTTLGDQVPPDQRVGILQGQSSSYFVAHRPDKTADMLVAAYEAVGACGDKCPGKADAIAGQIAKLAPYFHTTYTTTQDESYYGPAKKLYEFYLTLNRPDGETIRGYLSQLEETKQRATPSTGKHDKDVMNQSTSLHNQAILACYEEVLQAEPELKGSLKVQLDIEDTGKVVGVTTEPSKGAEGMAAVGTCIDRRAREWKFPGRSKKGKTAVVRNYQFEPQAAAAQPAG